MTIVTAMFSYGQVVNAEGINLWILNWCKSHNTWQRRW